MLPALRQTDAGSETIGTANSSKAATHGRITSTRRWGGRPICTVKHHGRAINKWHKDLSRLQATR